MDGKPEHHGWRRLIAMSPAEAYDRLRQSWSARFDLACSRVGFSFEAKLRSADRQPGTFFFDPQSVPSLCALLKQRLPQQADRIIAQAEQICRHRFDLLGYEDLDYGTEIDWHCDRVHDRRAPLQPWFKIRYLDFEEVGDSKVTWELNRHQHLVTLAKACRLSGNEKFVAELLEQWNHWQRNNPYPIGINWASSLEVGLRSLSWLWMYFLLVDSPTLPADFHIRWLRALAINGRHIEQHLSTYFSPNTHLLGEAVALFFIGTLCPEIPAAQRWKLRGWQMVLQEAERQVLSNGLHFEQSTYYHVYALDFFLHARILASANGVAVPPAFDQTIEKMLSALCVLGSAAAPPRLGDDDSGRLFDGRRNRAEHMLDPLATGAAIFGRGDLKSVAGDLREETLWLLGEPGVAKFDAIGSPLPVQSAASLAIDGLHVLSSPESKEQLVFDAGGQGALTAGHGHADALSVTLAANGRVLLIDPGTCEYVGRQRNLFRGTAAHNTLRVDEADQAEPQGPFGWAEIPRVRTERRISGKIFDLIAASHNGYSRLKSPVAHQRWIFSPHSGFYFVRDVALGAGDHHLELFWHLDAGLSPQPDGEFVGSDGSGVCLLTAGMAGWSREILEDRWSPAYGITAPAYTLRFRRVVQLPTEFATLLFPSKDAEAPGTLASLDTSEPGRIGAYRFMTADAEHFFCFARQPGSWQVGAWSGDAEFVYSMVSRDGSHSKLICCNARSVSFAGQQIVCCPTLMLRCEIICTGRQFETFSSEPGAIVNEAAARAVVIEPEPATTTANRLSGQ
jgi:hypothetical protein